MNQRKSIVFVLLLTFALALPLGTMAIDTLPPIPVSDSALRDKEAGITIFGFTVPGFSWDGLAIIITKKFIERMVDSTVNWINSGFEGNPAYVTDPKQYFTDIADGVAGEFISGSDLGFLCSPFQTQIRLALQKQYVQLNPFQCTLTQAVGNIDAFYNDFSQGGWDGWFAMTQNNANNPYGSYIDAKVELDSRIASAVGLKNQQLDWGRGFLSFEKCPKGQELDPLLGTGDCKVAKTILTPGAAIEGQLQNVLGTGLRQLELADEFDELVGALVGQLLQKTVFSVKGLFSGHDNTPDVSGGALDIDGDGIPDGRDYDGDGQLDTCYFGGVGSISGPPCKGSVEAGGGGSGVGAEPPADALEKHPDRSSVVAEAKAEAEATGIVYSTSSPECPDRFEITKRAAWKLKDEGAGLLDKPSGNNCQGYSVDIIVFPDGYIYDILNGTVPDGNGPMWNPAGCGPVSGDGTCSDRYRPAIAP
ncbi:MAG: hypothetical protein Q8Q92_04745 [bacterium]|nr:hypothetical protein [bacterium]